MKGFAYAGRSALVGCLAFLPLLVGPLATARAEQQIADSRINEILALINKNVTALAGRSDAEAAVICGRVASTIIDMEAVVRGASPHIWGRMSPAQRDAYRAAALRWTVRHCVQRSRDNTGEPLQFVGLRDGDAGDRLLATRSDRPSHFAIWRLRGASRLRVVDLVLDGASMTLALRDETNSLLNKNNNDIDLAIASLGR